MTTPASCYTRALNVYRAYRDYEGALAELEVARQSLPNDARVFQLTGEIQRRKGHWQESTRNFERCLELNPRDIETLRRLSVGADVLVHLAAYKIPRYGNTLETLLINEAGGHNILEVANELSCKVVLAS